MNQGGVDLTPTPDLDPLYLRRCGRNLHPPQTLRVPEIIDLRVSFSNLLLSERLVSLSAALAPSVAQLSDLETGFSALTPRSHCPV